MEDAAEGGRKRRAAAIRLAVLSLAVAVALLVGRFSAPTHVEERVRTEKVEVVKEVAVVEERVRVERVEVVRTVEVARRTEHQVTHPDGRVETTRTEETSSRTDAETKAQAELEAARTTARESLASELETRETKTVTIRAAWRVGAMAGTDLGRLLPSPPLIAGGIGARRLGPVWVGAWGLSNGTAGVSLELEF